MSKFWQDVVEQPQAAKDLIDHVDIIREKARKLTQGRVLFAGMGASLHACRPAALFLKSRGFDAEVSELSELVWYETDYAVKKHETVIFVSQSGESAELINLLEKHSAFLEKAILVTNNPESKSATLFSRDRVFEILAGNERAMGASKTFVNTVLLLLILAAEWASEELPLSRFVICAEKALETDADTLTDYLESSRLPIIVGRGFSLGVAEMIRLMFAEVPKMNMAVFSGGAFRHGPLELLESDPLVILLNPEGKTSDLMEKLANELSGKCRVSMLTNAEKERTSQILTLLVGEGLTEELAPLVFLMPFQKAAETLAKKAGYDPGEGVYASKVTRVE